MTETDRYFASVDELQDNFFKGNFNQHLTIRHQEEPLPFDRLEKIIIDDPKMENTAYFENAYNHLQTLIDKYISDCPLEIRQCPSDCQCREQYKNYKSGYVYHKFRFE